MIEDDDGSWNDDTSEVVRDATICPSIKWRFYKRLRGVRVEEVTFDQDAWNLLIALVNGCKQLTFLCIHYCKITHYDANQWKGMRPIYSILISDCFDADNRHCRRWKGTDVEEKLCQSLSERAHRVEVEYTLNKNRHFSMLFCRCVLLRKQNEKHANIPVFLPTCNNCK